MDNLVLIYILSISFSILFYFKLQKISNWLNIYDNPDNVRKFHKSKTPVIGGIINLLIISIFISFSGHFDILMYVVLFTIIGIIDDKYSINPNVRLLLLGLTIILFTFFKPDFVINTLTFEALNKSINLGFLSLPITILCILLLTNALNMIDGINGLCSIYKISSLIIILLFLMSAESINFINNIDLNKFLLIKHLIIIYILILFVFLFFNIYGKVFLGDAGVYLSASVFSYILITFNKFNPYFFSTEIILMIFLLPGLDMLRVFIFRIYNKQNPFKGDRNHLHHLMQKKLSNNNIILFFIFYQIFTV